MTPDVLNKRQNYRLWQGGHYGNKLRSWRSVEEWRNSGFQGLVVLRYLGEGGKVCAYDLKPDEVEKTYEYWTSTNLQRHLFMVNEQAPDQSVVLQGEYLNGIHTIDGVTSWGYFKHSTFKAHMRDALNMDYRVTTGRVSDELIRSAMTPSSYDDWLFLLDQYHDHVLEVSIYGRSLGDIPHRNALVWEVRKY